MKIGNVIKHKEKQWVIFEIYGEFNEYLCVTDFETQTLNEVISKKEVKLSDVQDLKVEWLFLLRRKKNLAGLEGFLK